MDLTHFKLDVDDDGIAVVLMDVAGEAVNTVGPAILEDFVAVLDRLDESDVVGVVIGSAKPSAFLAGADIRSFSELTDVETTIAVLEELQGRYARIEALHREHRKPVVMAIDGPCLGGGLELALVGSLRIATNDPGTELGQPEVRLGVLPAAGGTQRLPDRIGITAALDLILSGRSISPRKAHRIGLVDEVVPREVLLDVARKRAREDIGSPERSDGNSVKSFLAPSHLQQLALEQNPVGRRMLFKKAEERMLKETGGHYPAPARALEAVRIGIEEGSDAGFAAEARFFAELVSSPESEALRSIFFATRELKKETWVPEATTAAPVSKVGIVGGGLMGGGIATMSALKAKTTVRIKEVNDAAVGRALRHVRGQLAGRVKRRRLGAFEAERTMNRVTGSTSWAGFDTADIVIEAVFEDLDLKRAIRDDAFAEGGPDTVFASNTSSLPITAIAEGSVAPELVVGMHYFSPVEKMPLLEVIATADTADWVVATVVELGKRQGKTVIVVNDATGFYTTRVLGPYSNEAAYLLEDGASVEDIDGAMARWGFPVGPLLLSDEVGIDVGAKIAQILVEAYGDRMQGPAMMEGLLEDDRKGRKNGRGFYEYDKGNRGGVDDSVYAALGLGPRSVVATDEIQQRIALSFVNEAARCLEDGVLRSARDGDIGAVMGLGFPPFRGGPFWYVDQIGADTVVARLDALADRFGDRFGAAEILREHARSGKRFR